MLASDFEVFFCVLHLKGHLEFILFPLLLNSHLLNCYCVNLLSLEEYFDGFFALNNSFCSVNK